MAVQRPVVTEKKGRNTPAKQRTPLHPAAAREVMVSPPEIGTSPEHSAAFDPRAFLLKLYTGKSKQEYQDNEAVFSQGDAADAVYYVQSGKVRSRLYPSVAKKPSLPSCQKLASLERAVLRANRFAWPPLAQSNGAPLFGWRSG